MLYVVNNHVYLFERQIVRIISRDSRWNKFGFWKIKLDSKFVIDAGILCIDLSLTYKTISHEMHNFMIEFDVLFLRCLYVKLIKLINREKKQLIYFTVEGHDSSYCLSFFVSIRLNKWNQQQIG